IPGLRFRKDFTMEPGSVVNIPIDTAAQIRSSGIAEKLGVHVVADHPVMVYGLDRRFQTTDTYIAYPTENLGSRYRAVCFRWLQNDLLSQFAVVATDDSTRVTIHPSATVMRFTIDTVAAEPRKLDSARLSMLLSNAKKRKAPAPESRNRKKAKPDERANGAAEIRLRSSSVAYMPLTIKPLIMKPPTIYRHRGDVIPGDSITIILNRGEVYQLIANYDPNSSCDLTGSLIESDKPVALFSGHNCAYVPDPTLKACNQLVEQMPPIDTWGTSFNVGKFLGRSSCMVRVVASEDSTAVYENGKKVATINAGRFHDNPNVTESIAITTSRPALVAQYSKGFDNGDDVGDPMMIVIAPVEQYSTSYRFTTPVRGNWYHYITIAAPARLRDSVRLNGALLADWLFRPVGDGTYYIGRAEVPYGAYVVSAPGSFGLYNYGFGYEDAAYDAYGNAGGYTFRRR
ncbi:MAG: IgGFc-binding protein, partial [Bacteroidota bacterium]